MLQLSKYFARVHQYLPQPFNDESIQLDCNRLHPHTIDEKN
jgi:hypothetical protein